MSGQQTEQGLAVRALIRRCRRASAATLLQGEEARVAGPYASLVMVAADLDASPLLFLSTLAVHSRNLERDPRMALLLDGTEGLENPLAGERATLLGVCERTSCPRLRSRYLRYHPDAARYADFADFHLCRLRLERAHLVAGFGRIAWVPAPAVLLSEAITRDLLRREEALLGELEREQTDNLQLLAAAAGATPGGWRPIGLDPEGLDLARGRERLRIPFPATVADPEQLRAALVDLVRGGRRRTAEDHSSRPQD